MNTVDMAIFAALAALAAWAAGYTAGVTRQARKARKRLETLDRIRPFADYDVNNPINGKAASGTEDVWVSEYGTEWHRVKPL